MNELFWTEYNKTFKEFYEEKRFIPGTYVIMNNGFDRQCFILGYKPYETNQMIDKMIIERFSNVEFTMIPMQIQQQMPFHTFVGIRIKMS